MKKAAAFLFLFSVFLQFFSCHSENETEKAKKTILAFFNALKNGDTLTEKRIYPRMNELYNCSGSDSVQVTSIGQEEKDGSIIATVSNSFYNSKGGINTNNITIYLRRNRESYFIADTKGLCSRNEFMHTLGQRTGCIAVSDTTDLQVSLGLDKTNLIYDSVLAMARTYFNQSMHVSNFRIRKSQKIRDAWQASGTITCSVPGMIKLSGKRLAVTIFFTDEKGAITINAGRAVLSDSIANFDIPVFTESYKSVSFLIEPERIADYPSQNTKAWHRIIGSMQFTGDECERFGRKKTH